MRRACFGRARQAQYYRLLCLLPSDYRCSITGKHAAAVGDSAVGLCDGVYQRASSRRRGRGRISGLVGGHGRADDTFARRR